MTVSLAKPVNLRKNLDAGQLAGTRINTRKSLVNTVHPKR